MVFPLLPYFKSLDSIKDFQVVGNYLIELTSLSQVDSIITLTKSSQISGKFNIDFKITEYNDEEELINNLVNLYNNGISSIFFDIKLSQFVSDKLPNARIVYKLNSIDEVDQFKDLINDNSPLCLPASSPLGSLKTLVNSGSREIFSVFQDSTSLSKVEIISNVASGIIPIVQSERLTFDYSDDDSSSLSNDLLSVSEILLASLKTDREDGLYTTIVTDNYNQTLGLVYSSKKSISEALKTKTGVYQSRRHGLWYKGATSGATQKLLGIDTDCDGDCIRFIVEQSGAGFCHLNTTSCFGNFEGLKSLENVLNDRLINAPQGSYTKRLFDDEELLNAKIKEEAEELTEATTKDEIAWEAADLLYFALARCAKYGVSIKDIERNLELKSLKVTRRKGDAKPKFLEQKKEEKAASTATPAPAPVKEEPKASSERIVMPRVESKEGEDVSKYLERPISKSADIMSLVGPIVNKVKEEGDKALVEFTEKFDRVKLDSPVLEAPFPQEMMQISDDLKKAIDISFNNIHKFHVAQDQKETLVVETCEGVICSRFARPIEKVGLYIPGGTAVLPSTALMLSVPALVAGCKEIVFASPPGKDGKLTPEVVYVANKVGCQKIVLAGGAQAVAAMAYGTESVPKCDKIMGPGNQFVTAAKMLVSNDSNALCAIDMPAGPSEVLVIADKFADPDFVASDLLSQAEHGIDSQVILITVDMTDKEIDLIDDAVHNQAIALPRVEIVRKCISHSTTLKVANYEEAFKLSNDYAPEHLILQIENAESYVDLVDNAGSVFVGAYSPESCGDYSSGTNHTLPTYGYARMYSGVNTSTFQKFITSQIVTPKGLEKIGKAVMDLAAVEGLDGHRNAVKVRMEKLGLI
ncbi:hypothetical protein B5S31_g5306 [[Candida] boidinii]|nr:hypothetical protein B5S31_g5306 [[Candida] boidinii]